MRLEIDLAQMVKEPEIAGLDLSALAARDVMNIVLQRSEVLFDLPHPGRVIRAWTQGNAEPLAALVAEHGDLLARRAAARILAEVRALSSDLPAVVPCRIADIGCGYAFFDLFAWRMWGADLLLIDLEETDDRHFGFQAQGAAYSDLAVARRLLETNGVPASSITTLNPRAISPETAVPVDMAVSFLSCGFHYPVDSYMEFFCRCVRPGGLIVLDLRSRRAEDQLAQLQEFGSVAFLPGPDKVSRVLVRRGRA